MLLGIEIGGTKLQLGVATGDDASLQAIERLDVDPRLGAEGILRQITDVGSRLLAHFDVTAVGYGFGGPVEADSGTLVKSHQIAGWAGFPLAAWSRETFRKPAVVGNDADVAALAEARHGAGKGRNPVFYVTVGSGVGGGLIIDGKIYRGHGAGVGEIGHLRPGLQCDRPDETVEAAASGWAIAAAAQARFADPVAHRLAALACDARPLKPDQLRDRLLAAEEATTENLADLYGRCDGDLERLTARLVCEAAAVGNNVALDVLEHAVRVLGWGIAQVITLMAPAVVVVGGGVSLVGEERFFEPLRAAVRQYVFPPLVGSYQIVPARLGQEAVVHGAVALAADACRRSAPAG